MGEYTIQVASRLSGVSIQTLRAWERRYGAVTPKRLPNGHRAYSDNDIEKLSLLSELTALGYSISNIAGMSKDDLNLMLDRVKAELGLKAAATRRKASSLINSKQIISHLIFALEGYKLEIISHELNKLKGMASVDELLFEIYLPLLKIVAQNVATQRLTIAHKQLLTGILSSQLSSYVYQIAEGDYKYTKAQKILVAGVEGVQQNFEILLAAVLARVQGFETIVLGSNLPVTSLVQAVNTINADIIILVAASSDLSLNRQHIEAYIENIMQLLTNQQQVWLEGKVQFNQATFSQFENFNFISNLVELRQKLYLL